MTSQTRPNAAHRDEDRIRIGRLILALVAGAYVFSPFVDVPGGYLLFAGLAWGLVVHDRAGARIGLPVGGGLLGGVLLAYCGALGLAAGDLAYLIPVPAIVAGVATHVVLSLTDTPSDTPSGAPSDAPAGPQVRQ